MRLASFVLLFCRVIVVLCFSQPKLCIVAHERHSNGNCKGNGDGNGNDIDYDLVPLVVYDDLGSV